MDKSIETLFWVFIFILMISLYISTRHLYTTKNMAVNSTIYSSLIAGLLGGYTFLQIAVTLQISAQPIPHQNSWFFGCLIALFVAIINLIFGLVQFALRTIRSRN